MLTSDILGLKAVNTTTSLRTQVSDSLRSALITGQMRPGVVYSAPALATQLGVSATPVREAMLDLVREGMVEVVRNTGFRVTELTNDELDELAELRMLIEVPIMGAVAERCTGEIAQQVEELRPLAQELVAAAQRVDLGTYIQLDTEFHTKFLALYGNNKVVDEVRMLRSRSRLYGLESLASSGNLMPSTLEHDRMIDLALSRNTVEMEALIRRHIGHIRAEWADPALSSD